MKEPETGRKKIYFDKSEFSFQFETGEVWVGQGMKGGIIHDSDLVSHSHQKLCRTDFLVQKGEKAWKEFSGQQVRRFPWGRGEVSAPTLHPHCEIHRPAASPPSQYSTIDRNTTAATTEHASVQGGTASVQQI